MTQPAKVQEPSMEEILASIRRIIADDEAKPAAAEKAASPAAAAKPEPPAAKEPAAKQPAARRRDEGHSALGDRSRGEAGRRQSRAAACTRAAAANNSQDDIDAMLASLDAATPEAEIRPAQPESEVFELTDEMALPDPPPAAHPSIRSIRRTISSLPRAPPQGRCTGRPPMSRRRSRARAARRRSRCCRARRCRRSNSAFNSLANTVLSNNARTLEDLVKEMLRPMLKSWLDDNLPGLVERIVKAEIERVSRGR